MIDKSGLAEFLRLRRESLQPQDVGLPPSQRRRAKGLRREEVAMVCHISTDYYARLEQQRGSNPSREIISAVAQGLRLTADERDHLLRLAGHEPTPRAYDSEHISPGLVRILERLEDTPAEIISELGETLMQSAMDRALMGDAAGRSGKRRSLGYRWFADPQSRMLYDESEHEFLTRLYVSGLREIATRRGADSRASRLARELLETSDEFAYWWAKHEVGLKPRNTKKLVHPVVGRLELHCQTLVDPDNSHRLLVYTATPGSDSYSKLALLNVMGGATFDTNHDLEQVDSHRN